MLLKPLPCSGENAEANHFGQAAMDTIDGRTAKKDNPQHREAAPEQSSKTRQLRQTSKPSNIMQNRQPAMATQKDRYTHIAIDLKEE